MEKRFRCHPTPWTLGVYWGFCCSWLIFTDDFCTKWMCYYTWGAFKSTIARAFYCHFYWPYISRPASGTFSFFFLKILFIFRKRVREGEREGEKHQCVVVSRVPPTGDLAHNTGMCPDWESTQLPFSSQAGTQSTEPHQPGPAHFLNVKKLSVALAGWFS